ncbi:MAG: hypothetical protein WAW57_15330 [Lutibacter sp.]
MKQTFENYLKQARNDFAKVAVKYTVTEHLELRTAIDSLLIAYDQAVAKALILPVVGHRRELLKLKDFVKEQKDLPDEFAKIVDDNFWELL